MLCACILSDLTCRIRHWQRYFISCISVNFSVILFVFCAFCFFFLGIRALFSRSAFIFLSSPFYIISFGCTVAVVHCLMLDKYTCIFSFFLFFNTAISNRHLFTRGMFSLLVYAECLKYR